MGLCAKKLRKGKNNTSSGGNLQSMMNGLTMEMALDYLAIANDALDAQNDNVSILFTDCKTFSRNFHIVEP